MNNLGLEYVENTRDYDALRAKIYAQYGVAGILGARTDFDFPPPLRFDSGRQSAAPTIAAPTEDFLKSLLPADIKVFLPFAQAALDAEYTNSPIFTASAQLDVDRESVAQVVDRAYAMAAAATKGGQLCRRARGILNTLVLMELLVWRS